MKLLFEDIRPKGVTFNDINVIFQEKSPNQPSKLKITGKYISCDRSNQNGRTYQFKYMNDVCIPQYRKTWIQPHRAYGQLNHQQAYVVNPREACHLITSLEPDGKDFIGTSTVLCANKQFGTPGTPNGDILAAILVNGGKIGMSTRGAVDDPSNNIINEQNQYNLICIDAVVQPSGTGCYINDVVMEQKDFMVNEYGIIVQCAYNQLQKDLNSYKHTPDVQKKNAQMYGIFNSFLKNLREG